MIDLDKQLPAYHNNKQNIVRLVLFTSVFALVFINIYSPFGADKWYNVSKLQFILYSSLTILTGVLVVVVSRIIMYNYCMKKSLKIWQFLAWIFGEILMMALFYTLFEKIFLKDGRLFPDLLKLSARNTTLVLLLPYTISWLYLAWQDKNEQVGKLADGQQAPSATRDMIPFYDEKGTLKFSIKKESLLYIESAENYINIYYLNKNKVSKYLLRDTLKKIEEEFSGTDIIRCHRSYMVNFGKVKVIRRETDGLMLELDNPSVNDIPVSKTYVSSVMQTFSKYASQSN